ncbi:LRRC4B [Mytilus coruscus]|uniref:LRRC4B n=1 Tax=Mytilus coruscus TaxID=42192 RepID=A0A6J8E3R3_MYTCO|nr:LRRC4B [Mytilus coruscus]
MILLEVQCIIPKVFVIFNDSNFTCSCKVVKGSVDVDCAYLDLVEVPSSIPNNTVLLNLLQNQLMHIVNGMFSDISSLQVFDLSFNKINSIQQRLFEDQQRLEILNLGRNMITGIKRNWFVGLHKLDSLDFGENPIECKRCGFKQFVEWSKTRPHIVLRGWCVDEKSAISDVKVSTFGTCTGNYYFVLKH